MTFDILFNATPISLGHDPMEVTIDAAQWVRERIKNGDRRLLVVFRDWDPPSPNVHHPDEAKMHAALLPVESRCVYGRTAVQAASWAGLRKADVEAVLIVANVPSSARCRVAAVAGEKGCQVWHQKRGRHEQRHLAIRAYGVDVR